MSMLAGGMLGLSRLSTCSAPSVTKLPRKSSQVVFVKRDGGGVSSRTRRDKRGRKGSITTNDDEQGVYDDDDDEFEVLWEISKEPMPKLRDPREPDFWEGPQWDNFGFFIQYMWAFGILFAVVACGIAVATYNEGATDFKETPAYKESQQTKELLDESENSNPDVFEGNPTEVAPPLE